MSRDIRAKTKCAPKIYRKFSNQQRLVWNHLYREFNEVSNFPPLAKNEKYSQEHIEVTAHNMACQAAWELARLNIIDGRKPAHNKPSAEIAARLLKCIKPYIVKRENGGCQVLFPLSKLDDIVDAATSHVG